MHEIKYQKSLWVKASLLSKFTEKPENHRYSGGSPLALPIHGQLAFSKRLDIPASSFWGQVQPFRLLHLGPWIVLTTAGEKGAPLRQFRTRDGLDGYAPQ